MECEFDSRVVGGALGWLVATVLFVVWAWAVWSAYHAETLLKLARSLLIAWLADGLGSLTFKKVIICRG